LLEAGQEQRAKSMCGQAEMSNMTLNSDPKDSGLRAAGTFICSLAIMTVFRTLFLTFLSAMMGIAVLAQTAMTLVAATLATSLSGLLCCISPVFLRSRKHLNTSARVGRQAWLRGAATQDAGILNTARRL
jgi:Ca2+/Na+ antiporter